MENWTCEWREWSRQAGVLSLRSEDELPRVRPRHFGGDPLQRSTVRWVSGASSELVCASTATHQKRTPSASGGHWSHPRHLWCSGASRSPVRQLKLGAKIPTKNSCLIHFSIYEVIWILLWLRSRAKRFSEVTERQRLQPKYEWMRPRFGWRASGANWPPLIYPSWARLHQWRVSDSLASLNNSDVADTLRAAGSGETSPFLSAGPLWSPSLNGNHFNL